MELSQVRYFIALSRTLNFTRAAEACSVTQPALTRAIQRLEYEMGGPLLRRERNLTHLTELGRSLLPHLDSMLNAADSAISLADARRRQPAMSIKIGLGPGVSVSAIGTALHEIGTMLPNLMIRIEEAGAPMLIEGLLADNLDCALVPADHGLPERLTSWTLYEERLAVILPRTHELAARPSLTAADLADQTMLQSDTAGLFADLLASAAGCRLTIRRYSVTAAHLLDLVAVGLGIVILPETLAVPAPLVSRRLTDPVLTRQVDLAIVAGRPHGPALAGFVKICRARRRQWPPPPGRDAAGSDAAGSYAASA